MVAAAGVIVAVVGLVLAAFGWRGRRSHGSPRCARCGYDIRGQPAGSSRCPECGADLQQPRAVEAFILRRRRAWVVFGAALAITGISLALAARAGLLTVDRLTPTAWLLWQAGSTNDSTADLAIDRLVIRSNQRSRISDEQRRRLFERIIARHGTAGRTWFSMWGNVVDEAYLKGILQPEMLQRYLTQVVDSFIGLELADRDLAAGDLVELTYALRPGRVRSLLAQGFSTFGPPPMWAAEDIRYTMRVDGVAIATPDVVGDGFLILSADDTIPGSQTGFGVLARVPRQIGEQLKSGPHQLEVDLIINIVDAHRRERGTLCRVTRTFRFPINLDVSLPTPTTRPRSGAPVD